MAGYLQIDRGILNSTVWVGTDSDTKALWFFLLLTADIKTGVVRHTIPAIVRDTGIAREKVDELLLKFSSPDPDSRSREYDGRRIEYIDESNPNGGMVVLNYEKYREKHTSSSTERVRKYRERKKRNEMLRNVTGTKEKENKKEKELKNNLSESADVRRVFDFWVETFWGGKGSEPKFTAERKRKVKARLKDGFTIDQLIEAICGCAKSDFHVSGGYTGLTTILKSTETVESHIARLNAPSQRKGPATPKPAAEWTEEDLQDDREELGL